MFRAKFAEKLETHILSSITFIRKSCLLLDNVKKMLQSGAGQRWQHCMPDT